MNPALEGYSRPILFTILICVPAVTICRADLQPPATVATDFQIVAPYFRSGLQSYLKELESDIAKEIAQIGCARFGFVGWISKTDRTKSSGADTELIVALDAEPEQYASRIFLSFWAPGTDGPVSLFDERQKPLYTQFAPQPTGNPNKLRAHVVTELRRLFATQGFRDKLMKNFLSRIPLEDELYPIINRKRLVVPLAERQLNAADGSILQAELLTKTDSREYSQCRLRLKKTSVSTIPQYYGMIRVEVLDVDFDHFEQIHSGWHSDIPVVLERTKEKSLSVFMEEYQKEVYPLIGRSLFSTISPSSKSCVAVSK